MSEIEYAQASLGEYANILFCFFFKCVESEETTAKKFKK